MMLDEATVDRLAPNPEARKNARLLAMHGQLSELHRSEDETLLFGVCAGSGKEPYQCSVDFLQPDQPTYRCTCPSRQFPCKHCLALLYAYVFKQPFTKAAIPEDLQAKREKLAAHAEKKATEAVKSKSTNSAALAKKIQAQLAGIDVLERLTHEVVRLGLGNMHAKLAADIEKQAKQLGDAYLPGARIALYRLTQLLTRQNKSSSPADTDDPVYSEAIDHLTRIHALIKHGRAYLNKRLSDPNLALPTDSAIAAWLGHAWQLSELKAAGLVETNVELVQLAFNTYDDPARQEIIDTGIWMTLGNGAIRVTQTLRPYKALKHIKSDDSVFSVVQVPELCSYPGGPNPRIRWETMTTRPLEPRDLQTICSWARPNFASAIKEAKSAIMNPLADKCPVIPIHFRQIGKIGNLMVAEDADGERLVLCDDGIDEEPASCPLLSLLPQELLVGQVLIARFYHDYAQHALRIKPLSLVTSEQIVRLTL
jgi:hypothetical protein